MSGGRVIIHNIILIVENIMYYISTIILSTKLFGAKSKPKMIVISLSFYVLFIFIACCQDYIIKFGSIMSIVCNIVSDYNTFILILSNILLAWLCLRNISVGTIISIQLFNLSINMLVAAFVLSFVGEEYGHLLHDYIELAENIISMLCYIAISCTSVSAKIVRVLNCTSKVVKRLIALLMICISFVAMMVVYMLPSYSSSFSKKTVLENIVKVSFVSLIILILVIVLLLLTYSVSNKYIKSIADNFEKQIEVQSERYITLSKYNFELRRFRHDYKNMCIGVSTLISEGKSDEALEMLKRTGTVFNTDLIKFDTGNGIVDALLADKQKRADEIGAVISFEGALPSDIIKPADLCVIFGNTIDNALEACSRLMPEAEKKISVRSACNSGFIFIDIINPVIKKVDIKGHIPKTSKTDKQMHGFGLYSVEKALKQYDGDLKIECDDKQFHVSIELCAQKAASDADE